MTDEPRDFWRTPSLRRFGVQLRVLEGSAGQEPEPGRPRWRRRGSIMAYGGAVAAVAVVVIVLQNGSPARAVTVINRAPGAAARSISVAFRADVQISTPGRTDTRALQSGEMDFATGDYRSAVHVAGAGPSERRAVDGVLYVSQRAGTIGHERDRWVAFRINDGKRALLSSAKLTQTFTDPLALLRQLARTKSPVRILGADAVESVPTTHYRLDTDLASVIRTSEAGGVRASYKKVGATLDVWLDQLGRPRRIAERFRGTSMLGATTLSTVVTFYGYGQPVQIVAPAHAELIKGEADDLPAAVPGSGAAIFERLLFSRERARD